MYRIAENLHRNAPMVALALRRRRPAPLQAMLKRLMRSGADAIDLNFGSGRRAIEDIDWFLKTLGPELQLRLVADSPSAEVIEAICRMAKQPRPPIINSVWMDDQRLPRLLELALEKQTGIIGLCMGKTPPQSASERLDYAGRLIDAATAAGLPLERLLLDAVLLPHSSSPGIVHTSMETIAALRKLAPQCHTICGISNISFGLPTRQRRFFNAAWLLLARAHGLTVAICDMFDPLMIGITAGRQIELERMTGRVLAGEDCAPLHPTDGQVLKAMRHLLDDNPPTGLAPSRS